MLAGRYELLDQIASSERAALFHARDREKRQMVIVKRFDVARLPAGSLARYVAAVALLRRFSLPGAPLPLDVPVTGATPFAVYSPLAGESLAQLINRGATFSWLLAANIVARCAAVLSATLTSTGQSHRALKPGNLWLTPTGEVLVLDLGIAELGVYAVPPREGPVFVDYRAPEQIDGGLGDAHSDVFALGVLLYELTTGVHPFAGSSAFHVARQLILAASPPMAAFTRGMTQGGAREAEKLLARALARAPAERFASAQEFLQALEFARRVIGAPSGLVQPAVPPASKPTPPRPVLIVEDPTTIIQPPGLGTQRRASPARPQVEAPVAPRMSSASSVQTEPPRKVIAESQAQAPVPRPPQPPPSERVAPTVARRLPPRRELAPLERTTEPVTTSPSPLAVQLCDRTEVLPSTFPSPVPEDVTERDVVVARPNPTPKPADDELRTVAFTKHVRPTAIAAESTLVLPSRADAPDDPPTAVYQIPSLPPKFGASSVKGGGGETTLLLPSDDSESGAISSTPKSQNVGEPPQPAPRTHKTLIALNLICVALVLCALLVRALL